MQARYGVGAVLGDDDWLVLAGPAFQLLAPVTLGRGEVTGVDIPAVVTVEEKDVGVLRNPARPVRGEHDVDKAHRAGEVSVTGDVEEGAEVVFCRLGLGRLGLGLVGDGPDDDAGVVLVPGDEVADDLGVNLLGLVVDGLLGEGGVALGAKNAASQAHVHAHCGSLVDDEQSVTISVVKDVFGVRVVGGAQGVCANLFKVCGVAQHEGVVVGFSDGLVILVHAESGQVDRFSVDEEAISVDADRAHANSLTVEIDDTLPVEQGDFGLVEVALTRLPEVDRGDAGCRGGADPIGNLIALGVENRHLGRQGVRIPRGCRVIGDSQERVHGVSP